MQQTSPIYDPLIGIPNALNPNPAANPKVILVPNGSTNEPDDVDYAYYAELVRDNISTNPLIVEGLEDEVDDPQISVLENKRTALGLGFSLEKPNQFKKTKRFL